MKSIIKTLSVLGIIILLTFCSENSVESTTQHADAVGMRIVASGQTIVEYVRDAATQGEIEVEEGVLSGHMKIEFYDDESEDWFTPDEDHYLLKIEIEDTTIAQYWQHEDEEGGFDFHIRGKEEGHTHVVFSILHDGHDDFVSREIEIHVEHEDGYTTETPEGMHLIQEATGDTLVSWDEHDGVEGGAITVSNGSHSGHIEVSFFSHGGDEVTLNSNEFFLEFSVADTTIAVVEQHDTTNEPWAFEIEGNSVGSTTFKIALKENHGDHDDLILETDDFTIEVQ